MQKKQILNFSIWRAIPFHETGTVFTQFTLDQQNCMVQMQSLNEDHNYYY